jgi:hypothetical protein
MKPQCKTCNVAMCDGFVLDRSDACTLVATWIAGEPEFSFLGNAKIRGRDHYPIRAFRCPQCGVLKLYAIPEQANGPR